MAPLPQEYPSGAPPAGAGSPLLAILRGHCVRGLTEQDLLVIAGRTFAGRPSEAGPLIGYSEAHMRRRWDQVKEMILVPLGLRRHDDLLAGLWLILHRHCCALPAWDLLATDPRFATGDCPRCAH